MVVSVREQWEGRSVRCTNTEEGDTGDRETYDTLVIQGVE